jgi:hypothetical protein
MPPLSVSGNTICQGSSGVVSLSGAVSYTWTQGNIVSSTIAVSPTVTTYYGVNETNYFGCVFGTTVGVYVVNGSNVSISGSDSTCQNGPLVLTANGATTYTWLPGGLTTNSITVYPTSNTCYTLIGHSGSGTGCNSSTLKCITVRPAPLLSISGNTLVCTGSTTTLTASGASSYTWYTSSGMSTGSSVALTPSGATCYSLVGMNSSGCTGYSGGCISVFSVSSNPTITANFNICAGSSTTLYASGASTYTWLPGGSTNTSIVVSPSVTACYTLSGTGCSGSGSAVRCVTVGTTPVLSVSGNTSVCSGSTATLTAGGASSYTWYTSSGTFTGSTNV